MQRPPSRRPDPPHAHASAGLDPAIRDRLGTYGLVFDENPVETVAVLAPDEAAGHPDAAPLVIVFDGDLSGMRALMPRFGMTCFVAQRPPDGLPSSWEITLLTHFLTRAGLLQTPPGAVSRWTVSKLGDINRVAEQAIALAAQNGAGEHVATVVGEVAHELAANALLVAPVTADGSAKYAFRRSAQPAIDPADACQLVGGAGDGRVYLAVTDRFGHLAAGQLVSAIKDLGRLARVDVSRGGAGLGLRRVFDAADLVAVRVVPKVCTEVLAVIDLGRQRQRAKLPKSLYLDLHAA